MVLADAPGRVLALRISRFYYILLGELRLRPEDSDTNFADSVSDLSPETAEIQLRSDLDSRSEALVQLRF